MATMERTDTLEATRESMDGSSWGYQLIVDCFGCEPEVCCDLDRGYEFLDRLCHRLKMTKQTQPYIFKTCDVTFPGRPGYSGWLPIIESGFQIHTSAHNRFISIDVYSCKPFDPDDVVAFTQEFFGPCETETVLLHRGRGFKDRAKLQLETTAETV